MKPTSGAYIIGLDHLRALAAFMVLFWHAIRYFEPFSYVPAFWPASAFEEGWLGVTLFIVITGFVFTTLTSNREIHYFHFLQNRFLRIFPLLFVVMIFGYNSGKLDPNAMVLFGSLLGAGTVFGTWTLIIEWQFYISYPFLQKNLTSTTLKMTILKCLSFCLFFLILRVCYSIEYGKIQHLSYWTIFGQADAFLFGIIAGNVYLRVRNVRRAVVFPAAAACLLATVVVGSYAFHRMNVFGGFYGDPNPSNAPIWIIWPTISAIIFSIIVCSYCLVTQNFKGYIARSLAYLGTISYSTYMLHFIVIFSVQNTWMKYAAYSFSENPFVTGTLVILLVQYPVVLLVSALSYHFIEQPFLRRRVPYLRPSAG
mgnify:CR=1 FL=1